jgi:hypothetical protein
MHEERCNDKEGIDSSAHLYISLPQWCFRVLQGDREEAICGEDKDCVHFSASPSVPPSFFSFDRKTLFNTHSFQNNFPMTRLLAKKANQSKQTATKRWLYWWVVPFNDSY